jgi:alkylhydroperoxidase/carboxymuconolactone decarboxylase family protein YurZ
MEARDSRDERRFARLPAPVRHGGRALAAIVTGASGRAREEFTQALAAGVAPAALGEVARMAHLFGGFPRALHGLQALAEALAAAGARLPGETETGTRSRADDRARGEKLFRAIYREQADEVLRRIDGAAPGYAAWILEDAYGRVLTRDGLTPIERELLAIVALVVLDCPAQQKSHLLGALRLGAPLADVKVTVELASEGVEARVAKRAREVVDEVEKGEEGRRARS